MYDEDENNNVNDKISLTKSENDSVQEEKLVESNPAQNKSDMFTSDDQNFENQQQVYQQPTQPQQQYQQPTQPQQFQQNTQSQSLHQPTQFQPAQQSMQQQAYQQNTQVQPANQSKNSGLGIAALILSLLGCTFVLGVILAIVDLTNKDGKNKTISKIALGICCVWGFILTLNIFSTAIKSSRKGIDTVTTETVQSTEDIVQTTEEVFESTETQVQTTETTSEVTEESAIKSDKYKHEEVKNDFDTNTSKTLCETGGYTLKLPDYYQISSSHDEANPYAQFYDIVENGQKIGSVKISYYNDEMLEYNNRQSDLIPVLSSNFYGGNLEDINVSGMNAVEYNGYFKDDSSPLENYEFEADFVLIYDEVNEKNIVGFLIQKNDSHYDYINDFIKILNSIEYTGSEKTQEETEEVTEVNSENEIDPDFKAFMDSYEAFIDEYVDFMQKMNNDPSDLTILSEMSDYMTKYVDFCNKVDKYNSDNLNDAEMAYYIEVTTRCNEKILKAGISN